MEHTTIAVDLAKSVFQVAVSHRAGSVDDERRLPRDRFLAFFAQQPPATIVLEACGSAHYWARQLEPLGHAVPLLPPHDVPVFSNEAGEPLKTFKKAWVMAVLKAHGVNPRWRKGGYKDLSVECQQRFRDINLHWHDLRHEYASRLVERGVPLAQVRDLLGHASIVTTERYDNQRLEALQAAVERLEGGKTFDPKIDASDKVSRIFQIPAEQRFADDEDPAKESATSH